MPFGPDTFRPLYRAQPDPHAKGTWWRYWYDQLQVRNSGSWDRWYEPYTPGLHGLAETPERVALWVSMRLEAR